MIACSEANQRNYKLNGERQLRYGFRPPLLLAATLPQLAFTLRDEL